MPRTTNVSAHASYCTVIDTLGNVLYISARTLSLQYSIEGPPRMTFGTRGTVATPFHGRVSIADLPSCEALSQRSFRPRRVEPLRV